MTPEESENIIRMLYQGVLRRSPDAEGLGHYQRQLLANRPLASILEEFLATDEFRTASETPLFVPPGHFYSPVVNLTEANKYLARRNAVDLSTKLDGIHIDHQAMIDLWHLLVPLMASSPFQDVQTDGNRYAFDNPAYAWGDGSVLHAMIRHFRPRNIIEIGSGWSSACILDTVENHLNDVSEIQFVEPYPQLLHKLIGDGGRSAAKIKIHSDFVQNVPLKIFDTLEAGDILLIDSTHIVKTGSDCCVELFEILPRLKPGVIVHIHDIFWPFEYPRHWVIDENRSWNEIYAVRALLTDNPGWNIIMFNDYMASQERELISNTFPTFLKGPGAALWLVKV